MGMSVKSRIKFNKRRYDIRRYLSLKNAIIVSSIVAVIVVTSSVVGGIMLTNKVRKSTVVYKGEDAQNIIEQGMNQEANDKIQNNGNDSNVDENLENESNENSNIEVDEPEEMAALNNVDSGKDNITNNVENSNNGNEETNNENNLTSNNVVSTTNNENLETMNISILGEIMMGGVVTENNAYIYTTPFKHVYMNTNEADFTYANFSTNITNLEKIENAKSKYLVTKNVVDGLRAIGLDCVSIASDHIADYDKDIVNNTINTLEENDIFVAGREDMPVYFEKGNKKIAIVSTNAVFIGTKKNYTKLGVSVYSDDNIAKNIKEAKKSADVVIADIHWGREYEYGVTDQMRQISKVAIDAGADLIIGSHAAGVYPLESYKGKPIIFSAGYFIGDSNLYVGKESFIFNINISKENKIDKIVMTPIYIKDKKEVLLYREYNLEKANSCIEMYNRWNNENGFNSNIIDGEIIIEF